MKGLRRDSRIRKHPKPKVPHRRLRKLLQQIRGIGIMHVVVATSVSEQKVGMFEGSYVVDGAGNIAKFVLVGGTHVSFGIDGVVIEPICHC